MKLSLDMIDRIRWSKKRGECKSFTNLFWHIFSGFTFYKYSVVDLESGDEIMYSHTVKTLPHFDYIYRLGGGYHIGPSYTNPIYRNKGFHSYVLAKMIKDLNSQVPIFILVSEGNIASIKGIEKIGASYVGRTRHCDFQYKLIEGTELIPIKRKSQRGWNFLFHVTSKLRSLAKR